jgi:hypothetical protein
MRFARYLLLQVSARPDSDRTERVYSENRVIDCITARKRCGPRSRLTQRRWDQAAGAADATRKPRSVARVGRRSQEVSCDPLSAVDAGGASAS